jgi:uncharacterized membrane protein
MAILILGLILFFGAHLTPTFPDFQASLVQKYGEKAFKGGFSLVSVVGFALIVLGVSAARGSGVDVQLWNPPIWTRHLAIALMLPAFIVLASMGVASHIRDKVRHPMLAAIKLWAAAHLLANGDLLALLLFGSFLAYGVYDRISVKKRAVPLKPKAPEGWRGDAIAVAIGTVLWAATLFWLHAAAGVPLLHASA